MTTVPSSTWRTYNPAMSKCIQKCLGEKHEALRSKSSSYGGSNARKEKSVRFWHAKPYDLCFMDFAWKLRPNCRVRDPYSCLMVSVRMKVRAAQTHCGAMAWASKRRHRRTKPGGKLWCTRSTVKDERDAQTHQTNEQFHVERQRMQYHPLDYCGEWNRSACAT